MEVAPRCLHVGLRIFGGALQVEEVGTRQLYKSVASSLLRLSAKLLSLGYLLLRYIVSPAHGPLHGLTEDLVAEGQVTAKPSPAAVQHFCEVDGNEVYQLAIRRGTGATWFTGTIEGG